MSRTTTHRPGRLRALAVVSALAVSMIAGAAAPALADDAGDSTFPGSTTGQEASQKAPGAPWNRGDDFTTHGISWW